MAVKHKLTVKEVDAKGAGRHGDGAGLWLQVKPSGSRSWLFQFTAKGKERQLGLGPYPRVSLKQARKNAEGARAMLEKGEDPIDAKEAARLLCPLLGRKQTIHRYTPRSAFDPSRTRTRLSIGPFPSRSETFPTGYDTVYRPWSAESSLVGVNREAKRDVS
jgi:Arm DNA-binding domain